MTPATCIAPKPGLVGYKAKGCRCKTCTRASRDYEARRRRLIAYGRWETATDAAHVVEHIHRLRKAGIGVRRIALLAGLGQATVSTLAWPGQKKTRKVRPATAAAILAIPAERPPLAPSTLIDPTGTHRRIQALHCLGWTHSDIAKDLGCSRENISLTLRSPRVKVKTAQRIARVYERLSARTPHPGPGATRARNYAAKHGWAPPLAWDDETIDDPTASPDRGDPDADVADHVLIDRFLNGQDTRLSPINKIFAVTIGQQRGIPLYRLGQRLHVSHTTTRQLAQQGTQLELAA